MESASPRFEDLSVDYTALDQERRPWLDRPMGWMRARMLSSRHRAWRENGYVILKNFLPDDLIDAYCRLRAAYDNPRGWGPVAYVHHDEIKDVCLYKPLVDVLEGLLGDRVILHLNLTGWVSSERNWHQDDYLNPPAVRGSYLAVWMALDDIHPDCGPFEYVPGSHRWRVLSGEKVRAQLPEDQARQLGGTHDAGHWASYSQEMVSGAAERYIAERGGEVKQFLGQRGDVLIWHGCLLHRGSPPRVPGMLRKSLIAHYSGEKNREDFRRDLTRTYKTGGLYQWFPMPLVY